MGLVGGNETFPGRPASLPAASSSYSPSSPPSSPPSPAAPAVPLPGWLVRRSPFLAPALIREAISLRFSLGPRPAAAPDRALKAPPAASFSLARRPVRRLRGLAPAAAPFVKFGAGFSFACSASGTISSSSRKVRKVGIDARTPFHRLVVRWEASSSNLELRCSALLLLSLLAAAANALPSPSLAGDVAAETCWAPS